MSNPTSNFGWVMPTSTDLVTDLPADFAVFGQAVDTSMADLKGGTTGQILSKATNADMDFTWITNDIGDITAVNVTAPITGGGSSGAVTIGVSAASTSASGVVQLSDSTSTTSSVLASTPTATKSAYDLANAAIPKSTVTTAGDVIYATGSSAVTRLGIGTAGQVLTVNGGGTAPSWATPASATSFSNNGILNSAFQIWQRGTSSAVTSSSVSFMLADRWNSYRGATGSTVSRQPTNDTTNLPNIQYCQRFQRDSGNTSTANLNLIQNIETANSIPFAGKAVTLSFYARAGANYSATSNALGVWLRTGTGTDQNFLSGFTGVSDVTLSSGSATLTTTWQRFTFTGTVFSTATELAIQIQANPTGTAGANDYFEVTGVQLEVGTGATAFHTNQPTIGTELAACQRYFYAITADGVNNGAAPISQFGTATATGTAQFTIPTAVTMRTAPSCSFSSITGFRVYDAVNAAVATTSMALSSAGAQPNAIIISASASPITQYRPYYLIPGVSATNYLYMNSEL